MTVEKLDNSLKSMIQRFQEHVLDAVVGGVSSIDLPHLYVTGIEEARQFILAYGFDVQNPKDQERIWTYFLRAVTLLKEELLEEGEEIPNQLLDKEKLGGVESLLVFASQRGTSPLQRYSCALLRIMHVLVHIDNDIFVAYAEDIQDQVLKRFRETIFDDPSSGGLMLGQEGQTDQVPLVKFETKPFKATTSSVIKLLTKPQAVALTLLDKIGIRFVTKDAFDAFRVIRFLVDEHLISLPNIMPDQSKNTLYPTNLFIEALQEMEPQTTSSEVYRRLEEKLDEAKHRAEYLQRQNDFSASEYRTVKFICRQLIQLKLDQKMLRFFFPFEVQILDQSTYLKNLSGESSHAEYKRRQKQAARRRVFRNNTSTSDSNDV